MSQDIIRKSPRPGDAAPNVADYAEARARFDWNAERAALGAAGEGCFNICEVALDRHVACGRGERTAILWLGRDGSRIRIGYAELAERTRRFASVLAGRGIGKGDRVFGLLGRVPDLYVAALGTLRNGSVFCPLFSAFGPEPVRQRMELGDAKALLTTPALYRRKVAGWRQDVPGLTTVLLTGETAEPDTVALSVAMREADSRFATADTRTEDMALLHFTSGTTGQPKGAVHVHEAVVAHHATAVAALDLHPDDVFWCTADPGWVTGTSYGIIAPLTVGATLVVDEAEFDVERWYGILEAERVNVWYTAPTAIRMLMKAGDDLVAGRDLSHLRFLASVGEPLNAEAVVWSNRVFGRPFHDNWWQTETGGIMIANLASAPVKPGSMGRPLPGIEAAVVEVEADGSATPIDTPLRPGQLALKTGWPSMFRGYLHNEARYRKAFAGDWYLSGDLAMRDADGYFWFVGRADDVIKSAGHLIGPFEVESALMEHPAVAEAAVIGLPDEMAGEIVKAYVSLKPGRTWDDTLARELLAHARRLLGPAVAPKSIDWRESLPRTRSG